MVDGARIEVTDMLVVKNGLLVLEQGVTLGDISIEGGKIARIASRIKAGVDDETIDASGLFVFPGFIDAHVHFEMENALATTADSFETGTLAALAGGTTTIAHYATQDRGHTLKEALELCRRQAEGNCWCDYAFHMSITDWNEQTRAELKDMSTLGISTYKLYMAYDALRLPDGDMLSILRELKELNALVHVHCENGDLVDAGIAWQKELGCLSPAAHPASRPPVVEAEAINRLLAIARLADCAVKIVHISTAEGLRVVREARARGQRVYVETCPQYLLLNDSCYYKPNAAGFVCSPPIRPQSDRLALCEALTRGDISTIATDHCSYTLEQKAHGLHDFSRIPNGLPGVEHRARLIYTAFVANGRISAVDFCRLMALNPARELGMYPKKGALVVGGDADITLWDPRATGVISAAGQHQNTDYTPYEGMRVVGAARHVLLGGRLAYSDGDFPSGKVGRYVWRDKVDV